jgi:hypothetical protein
MANTILYTAPAGAAGSITRVDFTQVEPAMLVAVSSVYAQAVGIPMKLVAGGMSQFSGAEVAANFAGVLVRELPASGLNGLNQAFSDFIPNFALVQGLCVKGYINVICTIGTPVRGGIVYVRVAAATGGKLMGDFEATADGSNNIALTGVTWAADGKDASGIAEIKIA